MLDADLAVLYGVTAKRLNAQLRRNRIRFPFPVRSGPYPKSLKFIV
jgi:ORF6N domain